MPTLYTAQSWLQQSNLLLQARPSTTRITTKYTPLKHPNPLAKPTTTAKISKARARAAAAASASSTAATTSSTAATTATLTLKTYDPVSGTTLKYETDKAAEVGRLIQILGRLARPMAGLPELNEVDVVVEPTAAATAVETPGTETSTNATGVADWKATAGGAGGGAGGKKGKKKSKK